MSYFHVSIINIEDNQMVSTVKFDNKEDAEHYAKNKSVSDDKHIYEVQKNKEGEFLTIKSYKNGEII